MALSSLLGSILRMNYGNDKKEPMANSDMLVRGFGVVRPFPNFWDFAGLYSS